VSRAPSLLETVSSLLERTYRLRSGLGGIGAFVIGDLGYRELYGERAWRWVVGSPIGARTLVRESGGEIAACIYYPDAMIDCLERYPPQHGVHEGNVEAFATFVEEIDHLLVIAERSREEREVSLFELELHADVSKHLVLTRFLAGRRGQLGGPQRIWLRERLFGPGRFRDGDPDVRLRYERAGAWAVRLLEALAKLSPSSRLEELRRFHEAAGSAKLDRIRRLED